jgi:hypothetical protein
VPRSRVAAMVSSGLARDCVAASAATPSATAERSFNESSSACVSDAVRCTGHRGRLGFGAGAGRMAGCGSAWHVDEWTKLLPGGRERTFSLRHGGFGRCHGAVGLMLVGAGQVTGLQTLADIGRDAANVVELAAGGIEFDAGALPRATSPRGRWLPRAVGPPWCGSRWHALRHRPAPGCGHARPAATAAWRRRPRTSRAPWLRFRRSVLVESSSATGSGVQDRARAAAAHVRRRAAPAGPGLRAGAPRRRRRPARRSGPVLLGLGVAAVCACASRSERRVQPARRCCSAAKVAAARRAQQPGLCSSS